MKKPFFIKYTRRTEFGGTVSKVERFEFKENRDIVLKGMQRTPEFIEIHAGRTERP